MVEDHAREDGEEALHREEQRGLGGRHLALAEVLHHHRHAGREDDEVREGGEEARGEHAGTGHGLERECEAQRDEGARRNLDDGERHDVMGGGELGHEHDVHGIEHRREEREAVAHAQREGEVVTQREEPHACQAQRGSDHVVGAGSPADGNPVDKGDEHAVDRREEGVASRRGGLEPDVLHHEGRALDDTEQDAGGEVTPVEVLGKPATEDDGEDGRREREAQRHEPGGGHGVERVLDHDERATPDGGRRSERELPSPVRYVLGFSHGADYMWSVTTSCREGSCITV